MNFTFEELGIDVDCSGFLVGSFNGSAEISIHDDGQWFVGAITLEGSRFNGKSWEHQTAEVEQDRRQTLSDKIYLAIWSELTDGSFKDAVQGAVTAEIEGSSFRSDYAEHGTLNRTMQFG